MAYAAARLVASFQTFNSDMSTDKDAVLLPSVMNTREPRAALWWFMFHLSHGFTYVQNGGYYYLITAEGHRIVAGALEHKDDGNLNYGLYSVGSWWYLKRIWEFDLHGSMSLPVGYERHSQDKGRTIWILIRHGSNAWPVQVLNNVLQDGWDDFCQVHGLDTNYKLFLSCECRWIFNSIILNEDDVEIVYDWSFLFNPYWRELTPAIGRNSFLNDTVCRDVDGNYYKKLTEQFLTNYERVKPHSSKEGVV